MSKIVCQKDYILLRALFLNAYYEDRVVMSLGNYGKLHFPNIDWINLQPWLHALCINKAEDRTHLGMIDLG